MPDNFRHAQYRADGTQIDDPIRVTDPISIESFTMGLNRYLPNTASGMNAMLSGISNWRQLHVGDSTTMARFANGIDQWVNCRALGYPSQLASLLQNTYPNFTTYNDNLVGIAVSTGLIADFATADLKFSGIGAGVTLVQNNNAIGGGALSSSSVGTIYNYTPASQTIDTVSIGYIQNAGYGLFDILADGVKIGASIDGNGANVLAEVVRIIPRGTRVISLSKPSGGITRPLWIRCWDSTKKGIEVISGGMSGQNTTQIADSATFLSASYITGNGGYLGFIKPHTVFLNLGINDYGTAIAPATTKTNVQTFINACRASGADVIGIIPNPSDVTVATDAVQLATITALRQIYADNGILTIDLRSRYGTTYLEALKFGFMLPADQNHPIAAGHAVGARMIAAALFQQAAKA